MRTQSALSRSLLVCAALFSTVAVAGGPKVPASVTVGGQSLVLNGTGMRQATVFKVDVYKAALYVPKKDSNASAILSVDQPWQLDLHFVREVSKDQMNEALEEGYKKNAKNPGAVKAGFAKMGAMMDGVTDGDLMRFRYEPGKGTTLFIKGKSRGTVAGADFAQALLSVWIGASPPNAGLKKGLLGG